MIREWNEFTLKIDRVLWVVTVEFILLRIRKVSCCHSGRPWLTALVRPIRNVLCRIKGSLLRCLQIVTVCTGRIVIAPFRSIFTVQWLAKRAASLYVKWNCTCFAQATDSPSLHPDLPKFNYVAFRVMSLCDADTDLIQFVDVSIASIVWKFGWWFHAEEDEWKRLEAFSRNGI